MIETRVKSAYGHLQQDPETDDAFREALAEASRDKPRGRGRILAFLGTAAAAAAGILIFLSLGGEPPAPAPARADVDAARAADFALYEKIRDDLKASHGGKWVVIANGALLGVEETLDAVLGLGADAPHRFVFRVGEEGDLDGSGWANFWYGPRFAGPPLMAALDMDLRSLGGKTPFPRKPLRIGPPGKEGQALDVFIGTVGPPLFLGHDDVGTLDLTRFEVPGIVTMLGKPHRRVLLDIASPALGTNARMIGLTPAFPREDLVDALRWRHRFWNWGGSLQHQYVVAGREGKWVLFGVDRVLGEGATPEAALKAGEGQADTAYHRYLVKLPRSAEPVAFSRADFGAEGRPVTLNGVEVTALAAGPEGPFFVPKALAGPLRLELAESALDLVVGDDWTEAPVRGGYAWLGDTGKLALVLTD